MTTEARVRLALGLTCLLAACLLALVGKRLFRPPLTDYPAHEKADNRYNRRQMVRFAIISRGFTEPGLVKPFMAVPRHEFVPFAERPDAYQDVPLPLPGGDLVLAPSTLATMMHFAGPHKGQRVLLVGLGGGYEAAILAQTAAGVWATESSPATLRTARQQLAALHLGSVVACLASRAQGWPEEAPFDLVMVRLPIRFVPADVKAQVRVGGRLVAIVGGPDEEERLVRLDRRVSGFTEVRGDAVQVRPRTDGRIQPARHDPRLPTPIPANVAPPSTYDD